MSNHVSNLDPPALISLIPGRTSAFMKRSLMNLPILGTGFRQGEFIAVDRTGNASDAKQSVAAAERVLAKGVHITTFVEGTRSPDGRLLPFKKGPFFLAMSAAAPCVPVSIHGTEKLLRKGSLRIHPGVAHVVFHPPIDPASFSPSRRPDEGGSRRRRLRPAGVDADLIPHRVSNLNHGILMIASLLVTIVVVALSIPSALVFVPLAAITGNVAPLYAVACFIVRTGFRAAGIRVCVEGRERVPANQASIFMANHVSNLDAPGLIPRLPGRTAAFAKRALFKIPVFGYCLKLAEFIPVDRTGDPDSAQQSVAAAKRLLGKGTHITTFVEGTRSRDGRLLPFKKGPFYLAMETGAPCIPVSIHGTETLMAKGSFAIRPGTAHIVFHAPIDPGDFKTREALMAAVRAAIASSLPESMRAEG